MVEQEWRLDFGVEEKFSGSGRRVGMFWCTCKEED
jgi:hypothetical protein